MSKREEERKGVKMSRTGFGGDSRTWSDVRCWWYGKAALNRVVVLGRDSLGLGDSFTALRVGDRDLSFGGNITITMTRLKDKYFRQFEFIWGYSTTVRYGPRNLSWNKHEARING